jgi:hypothetical protein
MLLSWFFAKNPTVEEILTFVPPIMNAISSAKAGQAFSVSFPLSVDAVKGSASLSWAPLA